MNKPTIIALSILLSSTGFVSLPNKQQQATASKDKPDISSLFVFKPENAKPLLQLADEILARVTEFGRDEREIVLRSLMNRFDQTNFIILDCFIHVAKPTTAVAIENTTASAATTANTICS